MIEENERQKREKLYIELKEELRKHAIETRRDLELIGERQTAKEAAERLLQQFMVLARLPRYAELKPFDLAYLAVSLLDFAQIELRRHNRLSRF